MMSWFFCFLGYVLFFLVIRGGAWFWGCLGVCVVEKAGLDQGRWMGEMWGYTFFCVKALVVGFLYTQHTNFGDASSGYGFASEVCYGMEI